MNHKLLLLSISLISTLSLSAMEIVSVQCKESQKNVDQILLESIENNRHEEITQAIYMHGANPNTENGIPLMKAISSKKFEIVQTLIQAGANVNSQSKNYGNRTPLMQAAFCEMDDVFILLLDKGAQINRHDKHGYTVEYYISQASRSKCAKMKQILSQYKKIKTKLIP